MMTFKDFKAALSLNSGKQMRFVLPDFNDVPVHFHITDVGSVVRNFIDCGGQVRKEQFVQIQLWLGADTQHRLSTETASKIIDRSREVLSLLPELNEREVLIEYQTNLVSQYPVESVDISESEVKFQLAFSQTQCLAALRHEQEIKTMETSSCCSLSSCCA